MLKMSLIETPLGLMVALSDETVLYMLDFINKCGLEKEVDTLQKRTKRSLSFGETCLSRQLAKELVRYFRGDFETFQLPLCMIGSPFQKSVWEEIRNISKGDVRSYASVAKAIGKPSACRAAASACKRNRFAILIPCHRVVCSDGHLGGYAGGMQRKEWLLRHERS